WPQNPRVETGIESDQRARKRPLFCSLSCPFPEQVTATAAVEVSLSVPAASRASRDLYVAIGVDCDPDRDAYPARLRWRGIEALPRLFDIDDVRWTLNVRADTQVRQYCGSAAYCWEEYHHIWRLAEARGSA